MTSLVDVVIVVMTMGFVVSCISLECLSTYTFSVDRNATYSSKLISKFCLLHEVFPGAPGEKSITSFHLIA